MSTPGRFQGRGGIEWESGRTPDLLMAIQSETTLTNQERGKEWEHRVIAVNAACEGPASNTVPVVL